jgi:hypothetical protein
VILKKIIYTWLASVVDITIVLCYSKVNKKKMTFVTMGRDFGEWKMTRKIKDEGEQVGVKGYKRKL